MTRARAGALLALVLLLTLYLSRIGGWVLQDPDEGRYAEIPREMIERGDWVTPKLFHVNYFEKPPLLYWLTAACFETFGQTEAAARIVPAVSGIATVLLTFVLALRLCGRRAAWLGAGILATKPLFFALSQALLIDMLLTACMSATMLGVYAAHRAERKHGWALLVGFSVALGMLAKGLIAIVLPGGIALAFLLWRRDVPTVRALLGWRVILVFLVVTVPWFVLVSQRNPDFLHFFFVREHFQRFAGNAGVRVGHPEGPFYYVPVVLLGPAPWTLVALLLAATRDGRQAFREIPAEVRAFCLLWFGIVFLFFSAATSKLGSYVLPAMPPLALLIAAWLDRAFVEPRLVGIVLRTLNAFFATLGALLAVAALLAWPLHVRLAAWLHQDVPDVIQIAGATASVALSLLATVLVARWTRWEDRGRPAAAVGVFVAGMAAVLLCATQGRAVTKTARELAFAINDLHQAGDVIVSYKRLMQSLAFYTGQRIVQYDAYGEIKEGARTAPDHDDWFWDDPERLKAVWGSKRVFVATEAKWIPELTALLEPDPRILVQDHRRVVLVNFPAPAHGSVEAGPSDQDTADEPES
ncbi:phospholipid carrier-dependent glycosyltransferase [Candidatus Binatia bacterium]|nr:phospholipid carrier-dependent glycosyltransferase [Candidatus Binatia bacterium]